MLLHLARRSLSNRLLTSGLTAMSIALSVGLLIGVENIRTGMRESFSNTISGTDLIVGSRGGSIQLLLYSVFGMGSPVANIPYETWKEYDEHPAVAWTIPYALGDSHRGYRVIGTTDAFYEHYRFRGGQSLAPRVERHDPSAVGRSRSLRLLEFGEHPFWYFAFFY